MTCPACGHAREGLAAPERQNRRRVERGQPLLPPTCSTARSLGLGDVVECGCTDPSHGELLVDDYETG